MKTFVITFSQKFPKGHINEGQDTDFVKKIEDGTKIHTIRQNYKLWEGRIIEVQAGRAEISLRYWSGEPYRSKQIEFKRLGKNDGVGIERINIGGKGFLYSTTFFIWPKDLDSRNVKRELVIKNDGLSIDDFESWFKGKDLFEPPALIHLTPFRYMRE